jgi:predicted MFS family arabinose efflux permease
MSSLVFVIFCLEGAVLSFNVAATSALIPSIADEFLVSQFTAGKVVWLYMLPYGTAALLYGPLIRIFDAKKVELWCIFSFSFASLMAGLARNIHTLFIGRFLMGVFGASVIPLALILISRHIEKKNRGRFVGLFFGSTFVASLIGLFLSGIIYWRFIFLIPAGLGLILCLFMFFYLPSFKKAEAGFKINYFSAFKNKAVISIFTYIFFISLFYHGIQQWLAVYFSARFYFNQFIISMLITITSLSGIFGESLGGWFSDIVGRSSAANAGVGLMILSLFLLLLKVPLVVLVLLMIVWGLGWTVNHSSVSTLLTELPSQFINEAASLNSSVRFVSGGLGAVLGGIFMRNSFFFSFSVFGCGLILLAVFSKRWLVSE